MALRRKRADRDNHDRWLVSYADFITLLFAFFVVMYAISSVNEGKYRVLGVALGSAFGTSAAKPGESGAIRLNEQELYFKSIIDRRNARLAEQQRKLNERMQLLMKNLSQVMTGLVKNGQVSISQTSRGVMLDINASALFALGDATLSPAAEKTLADVAKVLSDGDMPIEVEGYTDNLPISTSLYPSNWELSSARASSVVRLFIERGVASSRLTVVGAADNSPVVSNGTPEGRARNRRVTVTVLASDIERGAQPASAAGEAVMPEPANTAP